MRKKFQRLGGGFQLVIESSADLEGVLDLDESQWAATSVPLDALNCDPEFLAFLDDDANNRIRTDEIKRAVSWLLGLLKNRSGIDQGSSVLKFSDVDDAKPEGKAIIAAAKLALRNLGVENASEISLAQMRDRQKIISQGLSNGDGVIPPDAVQDAEVSSFIKDLMDSVGKKTDLGGKDGVDKELLELFIKEAECHLKWLEEAELPQGSSSSPLMPFGEATHEMRKTVAELSAKLDEYFACCKALSIPSPESRQARFGLQNASDDDSSKRVDPLDAGAMKSFMEGAPIAEPDASCVLKLSGGVNPLWQERLDAFSKEVLPKAGLDAKELSLSAWESLKARFAPYEAWLGRKKSGILDKIPFPKLSGYMAASLPARLRGLIEEDLAIAKEMQGCDLVKKLILFQAGFLEFANNFVSLSRLFNPERTSMIQAGRLVMDGRHFTLATKVADFDEHRKIAVRSDICIMYLVLSTGPKDKLQSMKIAVGVTSGFMRNLYAGKNGVFFTPDGKVWDAKIIDLLSQPVSFSEALRMPFYKLGEFMGRQADRFFTTKTKEIETKASQMDVVPAVPQPPQPQKQNAMNGSMLLMGGGVGIAALGTSFAFLAQALGSVSLTSILSLLAAVLLIFGGPVLAVSVYKLWKRNIAMFLEAGGWAMNEPLRMTRKMGMLFTHRPEMPGGSELFTKDLVNLSFQTLHVARNKSGRWAKTIAVGIFAALLLIACVWLWEAHSFGFWPFCAK